MCDAYDSLVCPVDSAFRYLGRRWGPEILVQIMEGRIRYTQLQNAFPRMSPRTLSARISELERTGVILRVERGPNGFDYKLTEKGSEMMRILKSIAVFSIRWHRVQDQQQSNGSRNYKMRIDGI